VRARPAWVFSPPRQPPPARDCAPLRTRLACVCRLPCLPAPRAREASRGPLRGRIQPAGRGVGPARGSPVPSWCTKCSEAAVYADVAVLSCSQAHGPEAGRRRSEGDRGLSARLGPPRGLGAERFCTARALRSHSHRSPCSAILWRALRAHLAEPPAATGPTGGGGAAATGAAAAAASVAAVAAAVVAVAAAAAAAPAAPPHPRPRRRPQRRRPPRAVWQGQGACGSRATCRHSSGKGKAAPHASPKAKPAPSADAVAKVSCAGSSSWRSSRGSIPTESGAAQLRGGVAGAPAPPTVYVWHGRCFVRVLRARGRARRYWHSEL
jgi:hypothetical protein